MKLKSVLNYMLWGAIIIILSLLIYKAFYKKRTYVDVSPQDFIKEYEADRVWDRYYLYVGIKGEYHVLDYYSVGTETFDPKYKFSVRSKKDELPSDFPVRPQKKINSR